MKRVTKKMLEAEIALLQEHLRRRTEEVYHYQDERNALQKLLEGKFFATNAEALLARNAASALESMAHAVGYLTRMGHDSVREVLQAGEEKKA